MQCKDIPDDEVVELARQWHDAARSMSIAETLARFQRGEPLRSAPGVVEALMRRYDIPHKLALAKVESLCERKNGKPALLEYGVSPHYAWPA